MSNANHTLIVMLLDASGSMLNIRPNTIDGINRFIAEQKTATATATVDRPIDLSPDFSGSTSTLSCNLSLVSFSTPQRGYGWGYQQTSNNSLPVSNNGEPVSYDYTYNVIYNNVDIHTVDESWANNYQPFGGIPLIDAFCKCIKDTQHQLNRMPENQRPGRIIFVSITDGEETSSKQYTRAQLNELIKDKTDNHNWQFVFLGANQDAISEANNTGIASNNSITYQASAQGVNSAFESTSRMILSKRTAPVAEMSLRGYCSVDYSNQDKLMGTAVNMKHFAGQPELQNAETINLIGTNLTDSTSHKI